MALEQNAPTADKLDIWVLFMVQNSSSVSSTRIISRGSPGRAPFSLSEALGIVRAETALNGRILCLINAAGDKELLGGAFGKFPRSLLSYLKSPVAFSAGSSTAPEWDAVNGLSFVHNHVRLSRDSLRPVSGNDSGIDQGTIPMYLLASREVYSWPTAVWTGGTYQHGSGTIPVTMVFGSWSVSDVALVERHFANASRWTRLQAAPEWIYHDLNSIFGDWGSIWSAATWELNERSVEVNQENFKGDVLKRMRRLNRAMATNIMLRESVLIQQNSLKEITDAASEWFTSFSGLEEDAAQSSFVLRCNQMAKSASHDLLVLQGILEQLQNLMTMIISIEQISQGQSVARLGVLGFVFLPLSLVAAIFGITTINVNAKWYPAYAIPTLLATGIVAILAPKLIRKWQAGFQWLAHFPWLPRLNIHPSGIPMFPIHPKYLHGRIPYFHGDIESVERGRSFARPAREESSRRSERLFSSRHGSQSSRVSVRR